MESFPRQRARTRGFRLGAPRSFTLGENHLLFLRSRSGTDAVNCLWRWHDGVETVVADPGLLMADDEDLPAAERARRERLREVTGGITAYSADTDARRVCFALNGTPYVVDAAAEHPEPVALCAPGPVVDPRIDPTGSRVAYVHEGSVWVVEGDDAQRLTAAHDDVTWGLADFISSEELQRSRGLWWLADGSGLLITRVDEAPVATWWISDPAQPDIQPRAHRYPQAGTPNADVSLWLVELDGSRREIGWDREALPYLVSVHISEHGDPLVTLLSRDQRRRVVLAVDRSGSTRVLSEQTDPDWVEVIPGVPAWDPRGHLIDVIADYASDAYVLTRDGEPISPAAFQVLGVSDVDECGVLAQGGEDATRDIAALITDEGARPLVPGAGVSYGRVRGDLAISVDTDLDRLGSVARVWHGGSAVGEIASHAETPHVELHLTEIDCDLNAVVVWPAERPAGRLPIIMSPYGGPHGRMVLRSGLMFGTAAWLAAQGFAVVVADGRGTPGRGPRWDRAVRSDLATPALDDQVTALDAALAQHPDELDGDRVGIRGWSFGGYLAALAVLRRPDRFHAAVAGAPVTEWRLYDTAYTERYLGDPHANAAAYDRSSLLPRAADLQRPLLLIHGLADDNVAVAHTLQLSSALLAAGRAHSVLPLSGVTHMTPQEVVAENLLRAELDFFGAHLKSGR